MLNFKDYQDKVGLVVTTLLTPKISDTYGATRVSSSKHRISTEFVVLHTTGNQAPAVNEAKNIHNNDGIASFNAVADEYGVYETVSFSNVAHHAGDQSANVRSLGFELSDLNPAKGYDNYIKYIAYVMAQCNITPSKTTVLWHSEFVPTSCGAYLKSLGKDKVIADLLKYFNIAKETSAPAPTPEPEKPKPQPVKPTVTELAKQVLNGDWGNDPQRSIKLAAAGHDAKAVQAEVNRILGGGTTAPSKPAPAPTPESKIVLENGRCTPNRTLKIMKTPSNNGVEWGQQVAGDSFIYDAYTISEGLVWVRSKKLGYWLAWRVNGGELFGVCDFI